MASKVMDDIKKLAEVSAPSCRDCAHFMPDEDFMPRRWLIFGKRQITSNAVRFARCAKYFFYCDVARDKELARSLCGPFAKGFDPK